MKLFKATSRAIKLLKLMEQLINRKKFALFYIIVNLKG